MLSPHRYQSCRQRTVCYMGISNDAHYCTRAVFGGHGRNRTVHLDRDKGRNEKTQL